MMTEKEHFCAWRDEPPADTYVIHGYPRTRLRRLRIRARSLKQKILA
jgi:hypothetical protein